MKKNQEVVTCFLLWPLLVGAPVVGTDGVGQLVVCGQNWGVKHSGTSVDVLS